MRVETVIVEGIKGPPFGGAAKDRSKQPGVPRPAVTVFVLAWTLLAVGEVSGTIQHVSHDAVLDSSAPAGPALALFLVGWMVMVTAMMLPATFPVLRRLPQSPGSTGSWLVGPFLGGFGLVWVVAGLGALGLDALVHRAVAVIPWLAARPSLVGASLLVLAGTLQLASSTGRRLGADTGTGEVDPSRHRFVVAGWDHGVHCLRTDGPLMLVMFAFGTSLAVTVALAAVMAAERSPRLGKPVAVAAGILLLAASGMALGPSWLPPGFEGP